MPVICRRHLSVQNLSVICHLHLSVQNCGPRKRWKVELPWRVSNTAEMSATQSVSFPISLFSLSTVCKCVFLSDDLAKLSTLLCYRTSERVSGRYRSRWELSPHVNPQTLTMNPDSVERSTLAHRTDFLEDFPSLE